MQSLDGKVQFVFKKVAVVEKFFDIIYSVHVESESGEAPHLRGRAGKHCGQKRTYRAVSEAEICGEINTPRLNILYRYSRDPSYGGCSQRMKMDWLLVARLG